MCRTSFLWLLPFGIPYVTPGGAQPIRLDRSYLDFGRVLHTGAEERELHIVNTGRVAFPFRVLLDKVRDAAGTFENLSCCSQVRLLGIDTFWCFLENSIVLRTLRRDR